MESPIKKAIAELEIKVAEADISIQYTSGLLDCIRMLKSLLPYEAQRDRKIAEGAWEACIRKQTFDKDSEGNPIPDKQTYLNKNHPL